MTPSSAQPKLAEMQDSALVAPVEEVVPSVGGATAPPTDADHLAVRLGLQRRASSNIRRHFIRHLRRVTVLLVADFAAVSILDLFLGTLQAGGLHLVGEWFVLPIATPRFLVALGLGLYVAGNYSSGDDRRSLHRLLFGVGLATLLEIWTVVWVGGFTARVVTILASSSAVWLALVIERMLVDRVVAVFGSGNGHAARTIFVGPAEMCREAASYPALAVSSRFQQLGFLDTRAPAAPDALGSIDDLARTLHDLRAETVVVSGYLPDLQLESLVSVALAAGCHILTVPRAIDVAGVHPTVIWSHGMPLMELSAPAIRGGQNLLKRGLDVMVAGAGLLVLSPLLGLIALAIRLDSRGPVFFRQQRVGVGGREFRIIKFRTMVRDADKHRASLAGQSLYGDGRLFKVIGDPRITRVGAVLRRTSLDELPQLWNVLSGEMSLVGPRPPMVSEVALYEAHHYARFDVKPGITGPWQVNGRNAITDFEQVVRLEQEYIQGWTIWKDLELLLRTVPAVLLMRGAA